MIRSIAVDHAMLHGSQVLFTVQNIVYRHRRMAERLDIRLLVVEHLHAAISQVSELIELLGIEIARKNNGSLRLDIAVYPISQKFDLRESYTRFLIGQMGVEKNALTSVLQVKAEASEGAGLTISGEKRRKFGKMHGITGEYGRAVHASVEIHSRNE